MLSLLALFTQPALDYFHMVSALSPAYSVAQVEEIRYVDLVGTTKTSGECAKKATAYLKRKKQVNSSIFVKPSDFYEWTKYRGLPDGECSAVYYEIAGEG